jgi:hypothetical protein
VPHGNTTIVRIRVQGFHHTVYSVPHTTVRVRVRVWGFIIPFIMCHMATQQLLGLGFRVFIIPFIMCHMATQRLLGLGLGLGFRVFIILFIMCHMATQQLLGLGFRVFIVPFIVCHMVAQRLLGLGLGFRVFIIPFIVCHMAAQQMFDLITNAIVGPWHATPIINSFKVKVCHYSYMCN